MKNFFIKYNKKILASIFIVVLYSLFIFYSSAQEQEQQEQNQQEGQNATPETTIIDSGQDAVGTEKEIVSDILISDFEESEDWFARSTSPLGSTTLKRILQRGNILDTFGQYKLTEQQTDNFQNHIIGVKTYFQDKGFDRVEISPLNEYILRGDVKSISVWTLGRNFKHGVYVKLRNYKGKEYLFKLGDLGYFGWRKLSALVPGWFPQSVRYSLLDKNTHFVSLVVQSNNFEPRGEYYFYFDYLTTRVNKFTAKYPGSEIKDTW